MSATAKHTDWRAPILALCPCREAVEWLATQTDAASAWANCTRGDWMLWLCGKLAGKHWSRARRRMVLAACECARLALPLVEAGEDRPRKALELAEKWVRGGWVSREQLRAAADAAYAAADAAPAAPAAAGAYSAAAAAYYADAAYYAAAGATQARILAQCADIVRQHYLEPPEIPQ